MLLGLPRSTTDAQEVAAVVEEEDHSEFADTLLLTSPHEVEVARKIQMTATPYFIPERFPIPQIPVYIEEAKRGCILGVDSCQALRAGKTWWPDPHVRDIVSSALLPCKFQAEPCYAIDIGANFGYHAMTMLQFNTRVATVEPQPDMCASLMASVLHNHLGSYATIHCSAIASSSQIERDQPLRWFDGRNAEHYGRPVVPFSYAAHNMTKRSPLIQLTELLPPAGAAVQLLKIDTDSIDCDVFQQAIELMKKKQLRAQNIVMESTGCDYHAFSRALWEAQNLNFTIYRTLLWERTFKDDGSFPVSGNYTKSPYVDEVFDVGLNRYLWRFHKNMSLADWREIAEKTAWQFFFSQDVLHSNPLEIFERT